MKRLILALVTIVALALVGCGSNSSGGGGDSGATITMGTGVFSGNTSVTIKAGQSVTFDDSSGGSHNLVTGTGGTFSQQAGAPSDFTSSGIPFSAGDKKTITFSAAGTYMITCTFHPSMQATITVTS